MTDVNTLLHEGIKALKAGQRDQARQLLKQVVKLDEENERGWLWLSGAVTTRDERRICLENVLTLNPNNEMAQKGLAKLGITPPDISQPAPTPPEEEDWSTPFYDESILPDSPSSHQSKFNDAWTSENDLCAYCAHPVFRTDRKCPNCKRSLIGKEPVYPIRSRYLQIWVTLRGIYHSLQLLGLGYIFFFIPASRSASIQEFQEFMDLPTLLFFSILALIIMIPIGLTVALFYRHAWAYYLVVVLHILSLFGFLALNILGSLVLPPIDTLPLLLRIFYIVCVGGIILIEGAYLYMIFMASGDFKKVKRWRFATASDRIKDPYMMDHVAQGLARRKMWAAAVVYWQHAVGRSPGNTAYLRRLAEGYARLGFLERSLDVLQTGLEKVKEPVAREEIRQQIISVKSKMKEQTT